MESSKFYDPKLGIAFYAPSTGRMSASTPNLANIPKSEPGARTPKETALAGADKSIAQLQLSLDEVKMQLHSGKSIDTELLHALFDTSTEVEANLKSLIGYVPEDAGQRADEVRAQGIIEDWIADRLDAEDITVIEQGILTAPVESWKPATFRAREDYQVSETNFATVRLPPDIDGTEKFAALVEELQAHMEGDFEQEPDKHYIDNCDSEYSVEFD